MAGGTFEDKMAKFIVHSGVEIANKEVGPELVQNIHVVRTATGGVDSGAAKAL